MSEKTITVRVPYKLWLNFKQEMIDREREGKETISFNMAALKGIKGEIRRVGK